MLYWTLCGQFQEALLGFSFRRPMWLRGSSNQSWEVLRPWGSMVLILYREKDVEYAIYAAMIRLLFTCTLLKVVSFFNNSTFTCSHSVLEIIQQPSKFLTQYLMGSIGFSKLCMGSIRSIKTMAYFICTGKFYRWWFFPTGQLYFKNIRNEKLD